MALIPLKTNPSYRELRQFAGILLPIFCLVVAAVLWKYYESTTWAAVAGGAGVAIRLVGTARPEWFRSLFVGWMLAVYPIGWVVGHLLLATLYYAVITPIGIIMRAMGRDPLHRTIDRQADSYWQPHRPPNDDSSFYRQY